MKGVLQFLWIVILISACQAPANVNEQVEVYDRFEGIEDRLKAVGDKILVINFWATSCAPCIKEMPHFNALRQQFSEDQLEILLVSLDPVKRLQTHVYPFIEKYQIKPEVGLLADENYSAWTEKIDPSWYGALPATLIIKGDKRNFRFGQYETFDELMADADKVMN